MVVKDTPEALSKAEEGRYHANRAVQDGFTPAMWPGSMKDKVLEAAKSIPVEQVPFTRERLVKACFDLYPASFQLQGYPEYPDSNKVYAILCGERGLVKRGYLTKENGKYEVAEETE